MLAKRMSSLDVYRLRKAILNADRKSLEAQYRQNLARDVILELELKYELLASEATLDIHTGRIIEVSEEVADESDGDENAGAP